MVNKISQKPVKNNTEGKATLGDNKKFPEIISKSAKSKAKTKEKIKKLLGEIKLPAEGKGKAEEDTGELEQRIDEKKQEEPEEVKTEEPATIASDYARRPERARPAALAPASPLTPPENLEGELVADRPPVEERVVLGGPAHKELFRRDISYSHQHIAGERVLSTLMHYLQREGLDATKGMSSAQEQMIVQKVTEYFGGSASVYQIRNYVASIRQAGHLPADLAKYKTSTI